MIVKKNGRYYGVPLPKETQDNNNKQEKKKKSRLELVPPSLIWELGRVFSFGAEKHGENSWTQESDIDKLTGSYLRHLNRWRQGEDNDKESGLSHLLHAIADISIIFLITSVTTPDGKEPSEEYNMTDLLF
mmetsp:Transcript_22779/g.10970  ORF Transcript_22779/g.10970 Transcript_22779/m.10970 type:complete len:131 (+) Transcript_22779:2138-2530(+)